MFVVGLAFAGTAKAGVDWNGVELVTQSTHAAFALTGLILGIFACFFGITLVWFGRLLSVYSLVAV
jgi:hypothetical protein